MSESGTVVLDNEPVQALLHAGHRQHRRALSILEAISRRNSRRPGAVRLVVPTAVRVEAGWNRQAPGAAAINRLRAQDAPLAGPITDQAAALRGELVVSVAAAHLGAVLGSTTGTSTVVTSDISDGRRLVDHLASSTVIVAL